MKREKKTGETCDCGSEMPWHLIELDLGESRTFRHRCMCGQWWSRTSDASMVAVSK